MAVTDRMLIGAIAGNPANYRGAGEYRYSRIHGEIFFSSAKQPHEYDHEEWFPLPSLNADGSDKLSRAFQRFIKTWEPERQEQLETFARRKGWDLAMELKYGGGALEDSEASQWQEIVNVRLEKLMKQARAELERTLPWQSTEEKA